MRLEVRGWEVEGLLDRAPAGVEVLSLDCFDTLIWRNTHAPADVFAEIDLPGGGFLPRTWAEGMARRRTREAGGEEIRLDEVHRTLRPGASVAGLAESVADELALEARHAFAFTPTVELIREAKRRGLRVVIVSDMYLSEAQLREHIAGAAGAELLRLIDRVFVSADHGTGKCGGLFPIVLRELGVRPEQVLHVGDNMAADLDGALRHGLHAAHLVQFDAEAARRLRLEAAVAVMLDPAARATRALCQPHRAAVSLRRDDDPAHALGHDVMGPVMHGFARWLGDELDAMAARVGRPVRPLFLMRDGHLPMRVFQALHPDAGAAPVEISRFVAIRASLRDEASLEAFLGEWLPMLPIRSAARQLGLFENEWARVLKAGRDDEAQRRALAKLARSGEIRRKIFARAAAFRRKLWAHLARAGVAKGDAVMLVDLGYNGTVQNVIEPAMRDELGLEVAGRYLLLREAGESGLDKRGFIDARRDDGRAVHAICASAVVIEQMCNVAQGSTIGFEEDGAPVREKAGAKSAPNPARDTIQDACLRYAAEAGRGVLRAPASDDGDSRRLAAAATLARLLFLPTEAELGVLGRFTFDLNMGTDLDAAMVDHEAGARALRRRGINFCNDQHNHFAAALLGRQGLAGSLALFAATRFALDLRHTDFETGGVEVPVIVATATEQAIVPYTAWPTAEGYYRLQVPVGARRPTLGVQLGALCEWVQLEEVSFTPLADLGPDRRGDPRTVSAPAIPDGMEALAPDLYRAGPAAMLFVPPPAGDEPAVLSVVFRPVRRREAAPELRAAA